MAVSVRILLAAAGQILLATNTSAEESSLAEVPGGSDIDTAIDEVRASLDALRLFQLARLIWTSATFGLPGDLYRSKIEYISGLKNSAPGGRFRGEAVGLEFNQGSYDDWCSSTGFQFLSASLADPTRAKGLDAPSPPPVPPLPDPVRALRGSQNDTM